MAIQEQHSLEQENQGFEHFHDGLLLRGLLNADEDRPVPIVPVATLLQAGLEGDSR
jgi:hypothetical protein